jgi:hypothetical protein
MVSDCRTIRHLDAVHLRHLDENCYVEPPAEQDSKRLLTPDTYSTLLERFQSYLHDPPVHSMILGQQNAQSGIARRCAPLGRSAIHLVRSPHQRNSERKSAAFAWSGDDLNPSPQEFAEPLGDRES